MIEKIKNKVKSFEANTKLLSGIVFMLVIILLFSIAFMFTMIINGVKAVNRERTYRINTINLLETTDYLAYQVYNYVGTGDTIFFDNYINEIENVHQKEISSDNLLKLGVTSEEENIIKGTLEISYELEELDKEIYDLYTSGFVFEAQKLAFSDEYNNLKQEITSNYNFLKDGIDTRIDYESNKMIKATIFSLILALIVSFGAVGSTIALLLSFNKIREESDIDQLTGLQNRNKYKEKIAKIIKDDPEKYGALIFCDIDNLKFINDCYGHSNGDRYIYSTANSLMGFSEYKSMLSRPSGDEFIIYIHGFNSKEELCNVISEKLNIARNSYFTTTLHIEEKIRFSTGIAIYPSDSKDVEELIKFSDYAMFKMKKSSKGEIAYYDRHTIDRGTFLIRNQGYLDEFLEKELIDFAMQPIVDANTFEIYGYEALMRPKINIISSPFLLLELAKEESKLDKIERLVFKKIFEKINDNIEKLANYKIFINSIADQILSEDELRVFIQQNNEILKSVVVEVTEQEYADEDILKIKHDMFTKHGALLALDDYGSGYSNEFSLLSGVYDIIKIDMKIIRNIDTDIKRQEIVKSLVKVAQINNYKVLAEGVETVNEVKILQDLGIHYMQGFFFGKPDLEIKDINENVFELLK